MKKKLIITALIITLVVMFSLPASLFATYGGNISITKVADKTTANPGDTITYTITVTNTGTAKLYVAVQDPKHWSGDKLLGLMNPGQSITIDPKPTYLVKDADIGTTLTNTASVWTMYENYVSGPTASASAEVTVTKPEPRLGSITVTKRNPGGDLLAGSGFTLYFQSDNSLAAAEQVTDASGQVTFSDLPLVTYIVRETTAPAGYGLAPDQTVALDSTEAPVEVNFVDELIPVSASFNIWATTEGPGSITNPGLFVIGQGQSLNYLMTPGGGASITDVLVNGVSVGAVSSYTFVNVNSNQTIHVIFSSGGGGGVTVAAITEAGTIEVAGITELPRTGNNMLFYVIGFALMAIGVAFGSFFLTKTLRKRAN